MYIVGYLAQYIGPIATPGDERFGILAHLVYGNLHVAGTFYQEAVTLHLFQLLHVNWDSHGESTLHDGHDESFPSGLFLRQPRALRHSVIIGACARGRRLYPPGKLLGKTCSGYAQQQ